MKTEFQFIEFIRMPDANGHSRWSCNNRRAQNQLGQVIWYVQWRQFVYVPTCDATYSVGCLQDICTFIESLTPKTETKTPKHATK